MSQQQQQQQQHQQQQEQERQRPFRGELFNLLNNNNNNNSNSNSNINSNNNYNNDTDMNTTAATASPTSPPSSSSFSTTSLFAGSPDCPCIDSRERIVSKTNCIVANNNTNNTNDGYIDGIDNSSKQEQEQDEYGFWVYPSGRRNNQDADSGSCYPTTYGSSVCAAHDMITDPLCQQKIGNNKNDTLGDATSTSIPSFCVQQWCYVDPNRCKTSGELYFRSHLAVQEHQEDPLYYSYTTCNSTNEEWDDFVTTDRVAGKTLTVVFPSLWTPAHYKETRSGTTTLDPTKSKPNNNNNNIAIESDYNQEAHDLYYNESIPFQGWVVDYLETVLKQSNMAGFKYTSRSVGSDLISPSHFTASVADVRGGIGDVVATNLWITSERLAMTTFTIQVAVDQLYLWVPSPTITESGYAAKVLEPFDPYLWLCLFGSIVAVSFLSLLFATPTAYHRPWWKELHNVEKYKNISFGRRCFLNFRVYADAWLAHSSAFFGQTVDYDIRASYPSKILNFGFGFLILITVASYTANLAAFLTVAGVSSYIETMELAIENDVVMCAPGALQLELERAWPRAKFKYYASQQRDMIDFYDNGECGVTIGSEFDIRQDEFVIDAFCQRELIRTQSIALEQPLGFAVRGEYAAGLSFWMRENDKRSDGGMTSYADFEASTRPPLKCSFDVPDAEIDELAQLTPANFSLPFMVFVTCAGIALIVHFCGNRREEEKRKTAILLRQSQYANQLRDLDDDDDDDYHDNGDGDIYEDHDEFYIFSNSSNGGIGSKNYTYSSSNGNDKFVESERSSMNSNISSVQGSSSIREQQEEQFPPKVRFSTVPITMARTTSSEDYDNSTNRPAAAVCCKNCGSTHTMTTAASASNAPDYTIDTTTSAVTTRHSSGGGRYSMPTVDENHEGTPPPDLEKPALLPAATNGNETPVFSRKKKKKRISSRKSGGGGGRISGVSSVGQQRLSNAATTRTSLLDITTCPDDLENLQTVLEMMRDLQADHERLQAEQTAFFENMKAEKKNK